MPRLPRADAVLIVIDVQEKLMPVIHEHEIMLHNVERLVRGAHILGVPALLTEQYVKGLGPTVPAVRKAFEETIGYRPIEKSCFSGYGCDAFRSELEKTARHHAIIAGVEAHVCVCQSAIDLIEAGYDVTVIVDAVSSRSAHNKEIAIERITAEGGRLGSTEMTLLELLGEAGTDEFRAISALIK
jgi:nicotinamidase-related amidase